MHVAERVGVVDLVHADRLPQHVEVLVEHGGEATVGAVPGGRAPVLLLPVGRADHRVDVGEVEQGPEPPPDTARSFPLVRGGHALAEDVVDRAECDGGRRTQCVVDEHVDEVVGPAAEGDLVAVHGGGEVDVFVEDLVADGFAIVVIGRSAAEPRHLVPAAVGHQRCGTYSCVEQQRRSPVPAQVVTGNRGVDVDLDLVESIGDPFGEGCSHLVERQGLAPFAGHGQRVGDAGQRHARVDEGEGVHRTRSALWVSPERQEASDRAPGFGGVLDGLGAQTEHPSFDVVGQQRRHRLRNAGPTGEDQPLGEAAAFALPRATERVVRQRRRDPQHSPRLVLHGLRLEDAIAAVPRIEGPELAPASPVDAAVDRTEPKRCLPRRVLVGEGNGNLVVGLVTVAEVDERRHRLPVLDHSLRPGDRADGFERHELRDIAGVEQRRLDVLGQHAVAVARGAEPFGSHHDVRQLGFDAATKPGQVGGRAIVDVEDSRAEVGHRSLERARVAVGQESEGVEEVAVMVVVGVVAAGEHLVGRRAEEQGLVARVVEEGLGELAGGVFARHEMPEALELIEDHKVGLERLNAALARDALRSWPINSSRAVTEPPVGPMRRRG